MTKARLVVYADGFQPAVDEAVGHVDAAKVLDVADAATLTLDLRRRGPRPRETSRRRSTTGTTTAADDPHFWLDPRATPPWPRPSARACQGRPGQRRDLREEHRGLRGEAVRRSTTRCRAGLATVPHQGSSSRATPPSATSPQRYGFEQHGITGISPEAEPSAAGLKADLRPRAQRGVTTIYQETLVEPHFAETVAGSTGATVATLDPIEGITTASAGTDYFEVMRSNLVPCARGRGARERAPSVPPRADAASDAVIDLRGAALRLRRAARPHRRDLTIRRGEIVAVVGPERVGQVDPDEGHPRPQRARLRHRDALRRRRATSSATGPASATCPSGTRSRPRCGPRPRRSSRPGRLPRIGWLGRLRATDRQIVARSLDVVGLADRAATEVSTLSGGQQRRVLIARALAGQPDVLIMDEPTAGVDAANQHVLADVLDRLVERDVTMVIVTHELGALERLLTRIVVVDGGRIRFDGTPERYAAAARRRAPRPRQPPPRPRARASTPIAGPRPARRHAHPDGSRP